MTTGEVTPSQWAVDQFGEDAAEVMRHVITGLIRGQQAARAVQEVAKEAGATDKRAYGSMWATRYNSVVEQLRLAELPSYQAYRPKGASYSLALINGRVLIPFRHATSLKEPIFQAKLSNKIPRQVSRDNGVEPAPTLFDMPAAVDAVASPSVAEAEAVARSEKLQIVYVAYVANADSDEVLAAWWGTPISLEDDGTMQWSPERLDMNIATAQQSSDLHVQASSATPRFAEGEVPPLVFTPWAETIQIPTSEAEPITPLAADRDE